jgi:hypothetical protein
MDYVKEIGKNPLARKVKLADLTHNMDISRIPNPTQKDYDRIEKKYKPAYEYLKGSVAAYNNVATSERRPK